MSVDTLSFTVREIQSEDDLGKVCELRATCYSRHAPALRAHMDHPDAIDQLPWTTIFLCEDKASGAPVGTMRVVDNTHGSGLEIEEFLTVPEWMVNQTRGEMTRLVVAPGSDPLVKAALWKAGYLLCLQAHVRWLVIGARKPGLIRQYQYLGARDMYGDERLVPLGHGWSLPHRIFILDILSAEKDWLAGNHRLLRFMVETEHPDIRVSSMHRSTTPAPPLSLVASA